ncbi:Sec23/Sec24, helical domain [Dillenia turbinata]|uniref:Sec23/Sec24, helical domain n=1 Tax=Dillenia turbinata TaxID=194707 RepID=A0AAN8W028_9MAGN
MEFAEQVNGVPNTIVNVHTYWFFLVLSFGPIMPSAGTRPAGYASLPPTTGQFVPTAAGKMGPVSNGPPAFSSGPSTSGPRFPPAGGTQQLPGGPPPMAVARAPMQPPSMRSSVAGPPTSTPPVPAAQPGPTYSAAPPPSAQSSPFAPPTWQTQPRQLAPNVPPPPAAMTRAPTQSPGAHSGTVGLPTSAPPGLAAQPAPTFSPIHQGMPPAPSSPYGPQTWQTQARQQTPGPPPPMMSARAPMQAPSLRSSIAGQALSTPQGPVQTAPPSFSAGPPGMPPAPGSPYGSQAWQTQPRQVAPPIPGSMQPPRMFGMPPPLPTQTMAQMPPLGQTGTPVTGPSKIDPNQIPRPHPNSSVILYETRQGNQAVSPPPATSDYIVRDTGNCSPRFMRCTINQIPCTSDLLSTSGMQLALLVQPLALPHPSEEPIQVVDFGESGPVRCSRCKAYINPFMKFIDQGRRFICNLCGFTDETPRDYHCNLGPDGRRRDADERPELFRGTVEFVASKEFSVHNFTCQLEPGPKDTSLLTYEEIREPMRAVFFFLIDVSMNALQTGATAAACSAISQVIADLPESPRTMVGIATFDSTIHFYNLKRALQQPLMLIVPDVQDVYTPLQTDVIVQLSECRQHVELLLESIPTMFQNNGVAESAFGAAIKASCLELILNSLDVFPFDDESKVVGFGGFPFNDSLWIILLMVAAFLAMKNTGGKLLVFQSGKYISFNLIFLPSVGIGALSAREAEGRTNISAGEKEAHKLLQPSDKTLKTMAIEFAEFQVCVNVFITTQTYVDIASISVVPRTTGGQVYYYHPFSALSDPAKLYNDLRWNVTRPQGFEAVMRVRCSQGLQVNEYSGNFCKQIPTDIDLPGIDCDKSIMVTLKHDDKLQDGSECTFQCALLYTTIYGQRRIRVHTLSLSCTNMLSNLFRTADLDTQFACLMKQAANDVPSTPLSQVRDTVTNHSINILHSYRKFCATVSSSGQLILPEALKLLPLYTLALIKSIGLCTEGRLDDRSFWINYVSSLSTPLAVPLVYPRMITIHDLDSKEADGSVIPPTVPLSSEHLTDEGIYLLETGEIALIYIGNSANPDIMRQLFGFSSVDEIPAQFVLQQYDNPLSKKLNEIVNEIRRQRSSYLRLRLCKKGDSSGMLFFSYLIEDKTSSGLSYVEFLVHIHRQIQNKMT